MCLRPLKGLESNTCFRNGQASYSRGLNIRGGLGVPSRSMGNSIGLRAHLLFLWNWSRVCKRMIHYCHGTWATPELQHLRWYPCLFLALFRALVIIGAYFFATGAVPKIVMTDTLVLFLLAIAVAHCFFLSSSISVLAIYGFSCCVSDCPSRDRWGATGFLSQVFACCRQPYIYTIARGSICFSLGMADYSFHVVF